MRVLRATRQKRRFGVSAFTSAYLSKAVLFSVPSDFVVDVPIGDIALAFHGHFTGAVFSA